MTAASPPLPEGAPGEADFSLVLGGPVFQALRRGRMTDTALQLVWRRIALFVAVTWLPLLFLTLADNDLMPAGRRLVFGDDIEVHARFLVALPLLVLGELVVHARMRPMIAQFRARDLVPPGEAPRFEAALAQSVRLRNSIPVEAALVVIVFGASYVSAQHRFADLYAASWYNAPGGGLSGAGRWFAYVSLPIFQFLLARWYFRLVIWTVLLFRISRLDLKLEALHPDRCGGLGFLGTSLAAFVPLSAAHGVLIAGYIADRVLYRGDSLSGFKLDVVVALALMLALFTLPLLLFIPKLARVKRDGLREYGRVAQSYVATFQRKWIAGAPPKDEPLIGSGDIQSLADLANSYSVAQEMRLVPITRTALVQFVGAALAPMVPLLFTIMPAEQVVKTLLKMVV